MVGHLLRDLQAPAVLQVLGDAGRSKAVAPDVRANVGSLNPPADHAVHIGLPHWLRRQRSARALRRSKQEALGVVEPSTIDVGVQVSDVHSHDHLSHVVVVSCDSDFIPLVQRVKQAGRFVAGVGVTGRSSRFLVSACNEYKFYENLIPAKTQPAVPPAAEKVEESKSVDTAVKAPADLALPVPVGKPFVEVVAVAIPDPGSSTPSLGELEPVLLEVMRQLAEREGNYIFCGKVKLGIKRRLPAFDEQALAFTSFKQFLHFPEMITFVDHDGGGHVALAESAVTLQTAMDDLFGVGEKIEPAP